MKMYDDTYKLVLFGDAGAGKTTLTRRFLTDLFKSDLKMTIGVDFQVKGLEISGKIVKLQIWDFGGEERFRFLLPTYIRGANGGIFMYDITNYSTLAHIDDWLNIIRSELDDYLPILVVGGKADLYENREVSIEEGIKIARSREVEGFIECSSKTGENVEESFEAITKIMMQKSNLI
ncbi:MAG: Rab family GTPase [Promethearchaeia archaeon]